LNEAEFTTSTWPVQFAEYGVPTSTPVTVHSEQQPYATPAVLIEDTEAIQGTAMLFEYLSPWADWFDLVGELPVQGVGGNENGFGFRPPLADGPVSGANAVLSFSHLELQPGYPEDEFDVATRYTSGLGHALSVEGWWDDLEQQDWETVAGQAIDDILNTNDCWTTVSQQPMLRAYVGADRPGSAEAIAQLDVLVALSYWLESHDDPDGEQLAQTLTQTLPYFWNEQHQTFVNNAPNGGISTGDSWYTIQLHCDLARLAMIGNMTARGLFFDSLPAVIAFGQNVNYDFPVFFQYGTWEPISGSEPDVAGAYAWVMLAAWQLSGDQMYFDEAEAAIQALRGNGLNMTYEMHMTAASAAACAKLYDITGEPEYLDLLNLSLSNLLRHFWLYEMDFGYASEYTTMCGVNAMHTIHYIAAKEQHEVYRYLREAVETAGDAIDPDLEIMLNRILERMDDPVWYALPPHLPADAIDDNPQIGYNDLELFIPLEDLRDGAQQSGQIGQELYGAGAVFTFAGGYVSVSDGEFRQDLANISSLPQIPQIHSVYPNPANPKVTFRIDIPSGLMRSELRLEITNLLGRHVDSFVLPPTISETQLVNWDATNFASGIYFARLNWQGGTSHPHRFTILR
ncbi:MAG TPA: T9SS type A sorting domain-containing protein, partial [Bacteroidetes bacterium]|nr:T9SS type A sorting domain-containing protein [Bacteroidota bacterium]HEX04331.1 T9SS type A sorting domain-containing protein [Bacteroidota bacterium]